MGTLSASLAILNENGTIIGVNRAWRQFAETGDIESTRVSEGTNYLAVCDNATGANATGAAEMAAGVRQVLRGALQDYVQVSQWKSPLKMQWFLSRVARVPTASVTRAIVTHEDITALWDAKSEVRNLTRAVEQSPATVLITDRLGNIEYVTPSSSTSRVTTKPRYWAKARASSCQGRPRQRPTGRSGGPFPSAASGMASCATARKTVN
jgi:hypothetical protein